MSKEKKLKPLVGWMFSLFLESPHLFSTHHIQRTKKLQGDIRVIILPFADYKQEQADHKAQLEAIAHELWVHCSDERLQTMTRDQWLKYLRSIRAERTVGSDG